MRAWKKVDSRHLVQDRWLSLRADKCELPNGAVIEPFYVIEDRDWVQIVAVNEHDEILTVRQYRYAADVVCRELPGGAVDEGEDPLAAAQRELREETGYVGTEWRKIGTMFANPARQTNRLHVFLARGLQRAGAQLLDEAENIAFEFAAMPTIERWIWDGEFSQAMHIAAFHLGGSAIEKVSKQFS